MDNGYHLQTDNANGKQYTFTYLQGSEFVPKIVHEFPKKKNGLHVTTRLHLLKKILNKQAF